VCIPEGYTIYDKVEVRQGSMTFNQFFAYMKKKFRVEVTTVASGKVPLFNAYLPKHKDRRDRKMEAVFKENSDVALPQGRDYLTFTIMGETLEDYNDFSMPPIKYYFE